MSDSRQLTFAELLEKTKSKSATKGKRKTEPKADDPQYLKPTELYRGGGRSEWTSVYYKALRIGDAKLALRTFMILREKFGVNEWKLISTLGGCLTEDGAPEEVVRLLPFIQTLEDRRQGKSITLHHLWHGVYLVANCKKWYMTEDGVELEKLRHVMLWENGEDNDLADEGWGDTRLPPFALDGHSKIGRALEKEGKKTDNRLAGNWGNRWNVANRWKKLKEENPEESYEELRKLWVELHHTVDDDVHIP